MWALDGDEEKKEKSVSMELNEFAVDHASAIM
jgi:hypothetical protein